jgi:hypothetical protein
MGRPCIPLCDIAQIANILWPDKISRCADVVLAQLANPFLMASMCCNPEAASVPIVLYEGKGIYLVNNVNILS